MTGLPPRLRTVLLDLDGTLIDSEELILASYRHTLREHRGEALPDAAWLETMGQPLEAQLRDFAEDEDELRTMVATYLEHNDRVHDELLRGFPGVREAVEKLREAGLRLGIVTSKRRGKTLRGLEVCGYPLDWFETVVTASDLEAHKPDPAPVVMALDAMGEDPDRALFAGDSIHDLRAGRAAGVRTAAALWGPYDRQRLTPGEPDLWLERPEDLATVVGAADPGG